MDKGTKEILLMVKGQGKEFRLGQMDKGTNKTLLMGNLMG
jgi:hypothetical protein